MPFVAKPQKGLITYHSSPVYGALRDGTAYLKQTGFIKVEDSVEFGSADKKLKGTENHLQRKVYRLELTESGQVSGRHLGRCRPVYFEVLEHS